MGNKRNMIVERLKTLKKEMGHKQRFVIMDSETFRERWSFQLSARNLFVAVGLSVIVLVVLTTILIAFTSLREYIPGYMQTDLVEQVHKSTATIDSLEQKLYEQDLMLANIKALIMGEEISEKEHKRDSYRNMLSSGCACCRCVCACS
jgi:hypothetical protein